MNVHSIKKSFLPKISEMRKDFVHFFYPNKYKYVLLDKTPKSSIYWLSNTNIPSNIDSFTSVTIGERRSKRPVKRILTLFDGDKIAKRIIYENGKYTQIREYDHKSLITSNIEKIQRNIRTYSLYSRNKKNLERIEKFEISKTKTYGHISNIVMSKCENKFEGANITGIIKKHTKSRKKALEKQFLQLNMSLENGIPVIKKIKKSQNVVPPMKDKYLALRFIFDKSLQRNASTRYFLKKYKLDELGIHIIEQDTLTTNEIGSFNPAIKLIEFLKSATETVGLAAHEVRHAYQESLIGRLGKGKYNFHRECENLFGEIKDEKTRKEAYKFAIAAEKYPTFEERTRNPKLYDNNYLEIDAYNEEFNVLQDYAKGARVIASQFGIYI